MQLIAFVALIAGLIAAVNWWYWLDCRKRSFVRTVSLPG